MKIAIANDHAGVKLKKTVIKFLKDNKIDVINFGTDSEESVDYPDFIKMAVLSVQKKKADYGIVICGTGIGASVTANKFKGIRAALCHNVITAKMARNHNDANVLALGSRVTTEKDAIAMLDTFLKEDFLGERHARRLKKLKDIEETNFY